MLQHLQQQLLYCLRSTLRMYSMCEAHLLTASPLRRGACMALNSGSASGLLTAINRRRKASAMACKDSAGSEARGAEGAAPTMLEDA
jgi:hypothetical protein